MSIKPKKRPNMSVVYFDVYIVHCLGFTGRGSGGF